MAVDNMMTPFDAWPIHIIHKVPKKAKYVEYPTLHVRQSGANVLALVVAPGSLARATKSDAVIVTRSPVIDDAVEGVVAWRFQRETEGLWPPEDGIMGVFLDRYLPIFKLSAVGRFEDLRVGDHLFFSLKAGSHGH